MLLPQEQPQLPHIHPPVWSSSIKSSNPNSDALLAEAFRPFSASSLALCRHFSCQGFVIAIFYNVFTGVGWRCGGPDEYGEKCLEIIHPVKFEPKRERQDGCKNGSVKDTYVCLEFLPQNSY